MELIAMLCRTVLLWWKRRRYSSRDSVRTFSHTQKVEMWERQDGECADCEVTLSWRNVVAHHVIPWHENGTTLLVNGMLLCPNCHGMRTFAHRVGDIEEKRIHERNSLSE